MNEHKNWIGCVCKKNGGNPGDDWKFSISGMETKQNKNSENLWHVIETRDNFNRWVNFSSKQKGVAMQKK